MLNTACISKVDQKIHKCPVRYLFHAAHRRRRVKFVIVQTAHNCATRTGRWSPILTIKLTRIDAWATVRKIEKTENGPWQAQQETDEGILHVKQKAEIQLSWVFKKLNQPPVLRTVAHADVSQWSEVTEIMFSMQNEPAFIIHDQTKQPSSAGNHCYRQPINPSTAGAKRTLHICKKQIPISRRCHGGSRGFIRAACYFYVRHVCSWSQLHCVLRVNVLQCNCVRSFQMCN